MVEKSRIDVKGLKEVKRFFVMMPKKIERGISKTNTRFMDAVLKTAKKLVPKDTGSLAEDIKKVPVRRGKNVKVWKIEVDNPAAAPQEFGFDPHAAPIVNSAKMPPGIYFVRKNTPFLKPAIEIHLNSYSQDLNNTVGRAIAT